MSRKTKASNVFPSAQCEAPKLHVSCFHNAHDGISIVPLADLHLGAKKHNAPLLKKYISYILNTPNCYAIGLGDYIENATRTSVGLGMYEEDFHFPEQYERIEQMLKPLAAAKKLLGLHIGNHELRSTLAAGIDPVYMLCRSLDVPYLKYTAFHKWVVGDVVYRAVTLHGRSGAKTPSGRLNAVRSLRDIAVADVYLMGHLHDRQMFRETSYEVDHANDRVVPAIRYYIIAGGLLSWPESYADMTVLPPMTSGLVEIKLSGKKKSVEAVF